MDLKCADCGRCGDEAEFKQAADIELRHELGDTYSDKECPDCGALAYKVDSTEGLNEYVAIHEHQYGATVYRFASGKEPITLTCPDDIRWVANTLGIDFEPELCETLDVYLLDPRRELTVL